MISARGKRKVSGWKMPLRPKQSAPLMYLPVILAKVELIFKDCKSNLPLSAELAWELTEVNKVDVIMNGQLSSVREEVRRVVDETKTLYFFEAPYEGGVADHYTFCTGPVPEQNLYPMLDYLFKRYGKRCYIISAGYNYGILLAECAKYYIGKNGGSVIGVEYFQTTKSRFGVTIENIKEMNPDILLSFCVGEHQKDFFEQWIESGVKGMPIVCTIGIIMTYLHRVFSHIPGSMENVYCMTSFIEDFETPQARVFKRKIRGRHSVEDVPYIGCDAEHVYTTMYLYKKAVEAAGSVETEFVIKALESGEISFDGPGGPVRVRGEDHHTSRDVKLVRINNNNNNNAEIIAEYQAVHSDYVENALEKETGIKGGLKKLGLNSPNIQYNLMFHRIF
jgi:ABC-type branched-subunit amino acid transport system substrate-binding protein